jgi:release factor glutamine methyltransferase
MGSAQSTSDRWTVQQILLWSQSYLEKLTVSDSPRLDCELLLAHALGWDRMQLYLGLEKEVPEAVRGHYRESLKRRSRGEPIAYLLGYKDFWKHRFKVTSDVLIPRPDTETLVEATLGFLRSRIPAQGPLNVLDVGTGSGCIALSLFLDPQTDLYVTGWDIQEGALKIANENKNELVPEGRQDRIQFILRDARQVFSTASGDHSPGAFHGERESFTIIVSNPPYISPAESSELQKSVLDFEPHSALFAGDNGFEYYQLLATGASLFLAKGGLLLVEIGATQGLKVKDIFEKKGWMLISSYRDLAKRDRVLAFTPGSWDDLKAWIKSDDVDALKNRQESIKGQNLEYGALNPEGMASKMTGISPLIEESRLKTRDDSQKITQPSSAQADRLEVYYEKTLLSQEEENLLARYGTEDTHEEPHDRKGQGSPL